MSDNIINLILILIVLFFSLISYCFLFHSCNIKEVESVTIKKDNKIEVIKNTHNPYFTLGAVLTDQEMALPETRITNFFWLFEKEGCVLIDGEKIYFIVLEGRPNIVVQLAETPFESP